MIRVLLKKQLLELSVWFFRDNKTGKIRSRGKVIGFALLFLFLCGMIAAMFFGLSFTLCGALLPLELDWLYFAIMGLLALTLGVFGSVFNTYASLYDAKDNDLLFSLPIPPLSILLVRLSGVWLWALFYESIVFVPAVLVYLISVPFSLFAILAGFWMLLALSLPILTISCLLGWVVARINRRLRNKSVMTIIASLLFLGAYFFFYTKAQDLINALIANAVGIGEKIRHAYPLFAFGRACAGAPLPLLAVSAVLIALTALTILILYRNFIKLATERGKSAKKAYVARKASSKSTGAALLVKELRRFGASPAYMLNTALGSMFLLAFAILAPIKSAFLRDLLFGMLGADNSLAALIAAALIGTVAAMNDITAPSVSLEGKHLWIAQSLPVSPWQILKAKLGLHLVITLPPAVIAVLSVGISLHLPVLYTLFVLAVVCLFALFSALFGLFLNLNMPNLTWQNETVVIKQSLCVALALFGVWGICALLVGMYFLLSALLSAMISGALTAVLLLLLDLLLALWIKRRGSRIFAAL